MKEFPDPIALDLLWKLSTILLPITIQVNLGITSCLVIFSSVENEFAVQQVLKTEGVDNLSPSS